MNTDLRKIIILTFLISPLMLKGQSEELKTLSFGLGLGVSMNNVFNHISDAKFESRFSSTLLTINARKKISEKWGLLSELDYTHKGPERHDINYLVFSVLPEYEVFNKPNISLIAGPYIGYLFRYKSYGRVSRHDDLKKYDIGVDAGINFSKRINEKINLFVTPRIEVGMIRFSFSNHISYQLKAGVRFK